jgi:ornithine carbamoyltransferase
MQTDLRGRDFISDMDFSKEEIETVMDVALKLKRDRALGIKHPPVGQKTLALLFFFTSTRTRSSFEVGMAQTGRACSLHRF